MKRAKLLEMEEYIRFRQTISLKELQDHFDVSINTVRRYIATILESNPDIKKVYGGGTRSFTRTPRRRRFRMSARSSGSAATRPPGSGPTTLSILTTGPPPASSPFTFRMSCP